MSRQITRPINNSTRSQQAPQSYHPWIAHWMPTANNTTSAERHNHTPLIEKHDPVSGEIKHIIEAKPLDFFNENLGTSSKNFGRNKAEPGKHAHIRFPSNIRSIGEGTSNSPLGWMTACPPRHMVPYNDNLGKKEEAEKGKSAVVSNNISQAKETSVNADVMDFNSPLLFSRDCFKKMQQFPGGRSPFDFHSLKKFANDCDLEAIRICAPVDSVEAVPGVRPRFSKTTHSMLITKKNNIHLLGEIKKKGENMSGDFMLLPFTGLGKGGVKLRPMSSSSGSEGDNNVQSMEDCKVAERTEASAETDTMEMDILKEEKMNPGTNSIPSIKAFNIQMNSSPPKSAVPSRKIIHQWTETGLPDINLELPTLPAVELPPENICPSSSRTESLEMDTFVANAEHTKTKPSTINPHILDPSNRWVKRLKVSIPKSNPSSRGTKISSLDENSSDDDKMRKRFRNIFSSNSSDYKHDVKETISSDKNGDEEFRMVCTGKEAKESLLLNVWIKRWLTKGRKEGQLDRTVDKAVTSRDSKMILDDNDDGGEKLENKQFPSIGAMALMAKAMHGFPSCEIQKRGPITVWNTKTF